MVGTFTNKSSIKVKVCIALEPSGQRCIVHLQSSGYETTLCLLSENKKKWFCIVNARNVQQDPHTDTPLDVETSVATVKNHLITPALHASFEVVAETASSLTFVMKTTTFTQSSSALRFSMVPRKMTCKDHFKVMLRIIYFRPSDDDAKTEAIDSEEASIRQRICSREDGLPEMVPDETEYQFADEEHPSTAEGFVQQESVETVYQSAYQEMPSTEQVAFEPASAIVQGDANCQQRKRDKVMSLMKGIGTVLTAAGAIVSLIQMLE